MRKLFQILFLVLLPSLVFATHQRAGEITYRHLSGLTYEFTITTYTYKPSPVDLTFIPVKWGDGSESSVHRTDSITFDIGIRRNKYITTHTFPAPSNYTVSVEDPFRNNGVLNIPNSVGTPFYIQTTLLINPFIGPNSSPILLNAPVDNGCVNKPFYHNPGAYDPDGDSLSYKLIKCKGLNGEDIPGYTFPEYSFSYNIDQVTGDFYWDSPLLQGEYNIAILIEEWRQGVKIGSIIRDMQISISYCNNNPPKIVLISDTCVVAGDTLMLNVVATDVDNDNITLTATGGPLNLLNSPAQFPQPVYGTNGTAQSVFSWITNCSHVKKNPYQMSFKAKDNGNIVNLVFIKTLQITVISPAPENLTANPIGNSIILKWNKSVCNNSIGYKIYRHNGASGWTHDYCETGVPSYTGFQLIGSTNSYNDTTFLDNNDGSGLLYGNDYCYVVISNYSDLAESYASNEVCASLKKDVPIITNVSVNITNQANGQIFLAWIKPTEHDTIQFPGPYQYRVLRSETSLNTYTQVYSTININDTSFNDNNINTLNNGWKYKIEFYNNTPGNQMLIGVSNSATSIFVNAKPSDNKITLTWNEIVPWTNEYFDVFRENTTTSNWDSIGRSYDKNYIDKGLENGIEYCYFVRSKGKYSISEFPDNLINLSQKVCSIPIDNEPPCKPIISGYTDCERNYLSWKMPNDSCYNDVVKYYIYYSQSEIGDMSKIDETNSFFDTSYIFSNINSIAGCFAVAAVDSNNNYTISNSVCIDIDKCSLYHLPNVFSPNNDGYNELFKPFPYNFVDRINITIFNRYGTVVFTTNDPDINWDGKDKNSKQDCAVGVYFFVCDVYEYRLGGIKMRTINGSLTLLR